MKFSPNKKQTAILLKMRSTIQTAMETGNLRPFNNSLFTFQECCQIYKDIIGTSAHIAETISGDAMKIFGKYKFKTCPHGIGYRISILDI